ncbi:hypothetical protein EB796_024484 [Bugula neritina]|uniref:Uncharacterized protein n=1 Tax=Bugula neritina TaxID=10212 RepID=A0A7J7ITH3_BUGNE|nr:hypothetical protein EB796_024484 [Bugula neritina]
MNFMKLTFLALAIALVIAVLADDVMAGQKYHNKGSKSSGNSKSSKSSESRKSSRSSSGSRRSSSESSEEGPIVKDTCLQCQSNLLSDILYIGYWSKWGSWSSCSSSCGAGKQFRTRTCIVKGVYRNNSCQGLSKQSRPCKGHNCAHTTKPHKHYDV